MSFTAVILLSVLAQLVFNWFFAEQLYTFYKKQYMEWSFYTMKESYDGTIESVEDILNSMEETHNIQLIIGQGDETIYVTYMGFINQEDGLAFPMNTSEGENTERFEEPHEYAPAPHVNELLQGEDSAEILNLSGSFEYEGETIYVNMNLPVASLENSVSFFTNSNAIIAFFILIISIIVASRIAKGITKPIEKVEKITYNLANLEFDEYVSVDHASKEVDSLACSINRMSRDLKEKIDALNEANEKLQLDVEHQMQLEQMRREFIANVSHEMKTPLSILQFYCSNLRSDVEGIDKDYYYDTIIEEIERVDEMVRSMLDISSLENGLSKMELKEMDFSELAEHTVSKLQPLLSKFQVVTEIEADLNIIGDWRYLEQAIKNYITNAVSHTTEGGVIKITLASSGDYARFSVYNAGSSIEESQMERIWESFYKSDKARVREANTNVGLGLYIVKCIVENHSGTYGVANTEHGVEFQIKIPIL